MSPNYKNRTFVAAIDTNDVPADVKLAIRQAIERLDEKASAYAEGLAEPDYDWRPIRRYNGRSARRGF